MSWIIAYIASLMFFPLALPLVIVFHFLSGAEKRRSRKRQADITAGVQQALNNQKH